jgi:hypothetical protein
VYDPNKLAYIKDRSLSEEIELRRYSPDPPDWVYSEARLAVDEISREIKNDVHLDQQINYENYPNPADAMSATALDLVPKIKANQTGYVDKASYVNNDGVYLSASGKVISQVREWYVDEVLYQVNKTYLGAAEMINEQIDNNFDDPDGVRDANKKGAGLLKSILRFPVGVTMTAEHVMENGTHYDPDELAYWDENVTIGVNMEPDFLDHAEPYPGESFYTLKLRNTNLLGPTGLYLLPSMNPWICTVNSWYIEVEGEMVNFLIFDADNVCHPNPMFGHEWQVYQREHLQIRDPVTNNIIGLNLPITFSFSTGTFIAVPGGKIEGVGDKPTLDEKIPFIEETKGW